MMFKSSNTDVNGLKAGLAEYVLISILHAPLVNALIESRVGTITIVRRVRDQEIPQSDDPNHKPVIR